MPPESEEVIEPNFEELAKADGWMPKEEFRGPPERWVDAKTFVERGAQILPIVQAKNRKLVETVDSLQRKVSDLETGSSLFREYHEKTLARERQEHERLVAELEQARAKAITDGDGTAYIKADQRLQEVRKDAPVERRPQLSAETQAWLTENDWYQTDPVLKAMADGLSDHLKRENPALSGRAFLDKLTERVKTEMPHKFQNARRSETVTEENGRKGPQKKGKTFEDLPQDAQDACAQFERTIKGFTREQYLKTYRWD